MSEMIEWSWSWTPHALAVGGRRSLSMVRVSEIERGAVRVRTSYSTVNAAIVLSPSPWCCLIYRSAFHKKLCDSSRRSWHMLSAPEGSQWMVYMQHPQKQRHRSPALVSPVLINARCPRCTPKLPMTMKFNNSISETDWWDLRGRVQLDFEHDISIALLPHYDWIRRRVWKLQANPR